MLNSYIKFFLVAFIVRTFRTRIKIPLLTTHAFLTKKSLHLIYLQAKYYFDNNRGTKIQIRT